MLSHLRVKLSYFSCAWLQRPASGLFNFVKEILPSVLKYEVIIWNDNSAAIDIVNIGKFPQKTRHMATKCNYVYQQVKNGIFKVQWKLTKGFHPENFRQKLKLYQGAISLKLLENRKQWGFSVGSRGPATPFDASPATPGPQLFFVNFT